MRFPLIALTALTSFALASGCVVYSDPPSGDPDNTLPGDITFSWTFDGESRCTRADVAELDVQVFGPDNNIAFSETIECLGGGVTLRDFAAGRHEILIDAFDRFGDLRYTADPVTLTVSGGRDNDLGTIELFSPGQNGQDGSIASFWSFKYPTDESQVLDCAVAGTDEVFVEIIPLNSNAPVFSQAFACDAEGFLVDGMAPGDYEVTLLALGDYDNQDLPLYTNDPILVTVAPGALSDLGDILLDRVFDSFADIEVSWGFGSGDCESRGVGDIEVTILRAEGGLEDDVFTAPCDTLVSVRRTFVPGGYAISARGVGTGNVEYVGSVTLDVAPNAVGVADISLILGG